MPEQFDALFAKKNKTEEELDLERAIKTLQLELAEREQSLTRLEQELARRRSEAEAEVAERARARLEALLTDLAGPVAQLQTQAYLVETAGKPVQVRDVLAVAGRLTRVLADNGLTAVGQVGQTVPFDPDRHELLDSGAGLAAGEPVAVRFGGMAYQGRLLRKAGVTRVEG